MVIMQTLIIPLLRSMFLFTFLGGLIFVIAIAWHKVWNTKYKWILKYRNKDYDPEDVELILRLCQETDKEIVMMRLLEAGISLNKVREYMFIYGKLKEGGN